jgi:hypothetical protein
VRERLSSTSRSTRLTPDELPFAMPSWTVGLARLRERPDDPAMDWLINLICQTAETI